MTRTMLGRAIALENSSSLLPPGQGEESGSPVRERSRWPNRKADRAVCAPPPWKGGGREGGCPGTDRTGVSRPPPAPRRPALSSPPWKGAGGMTPPPTRTPARDPPPDLPPERGEERRRRPRAPCPAIAVSACHRKISIRDRPAMLGASRRWRGTSPSPTSPLEGGGEERKRQPKALPRPDSPWP